MGNLCGSFCSTAHKTAPLQPPPACEDEDFMNVVLQAKVTKRGWQRSVSRLLGNCKEVKNWRTNPDGRVEISAIGNSKKLLNRIGKSRYIEHGWIQSGECSSNLFRQESSSKEPQHNNYPPHPHQITKSYDYGYGPNYANQYGHNGYGYPTQRIPYYT